MMVPAPGLFSMMMVAPRFFAISCASVRAITSVPPPGANGTTIRMVFSGHAATAELTGNANTEAHAPSASSSSSILRDEPNDMYLLRRGARHIGVGDADFPQHLLRMLADRGDA